MKSTQAMRNRIRELMNREQDDYDRAVECVLDDLEALLRPCGECHIQPGERCDICGKVGPVSSHNQTSTKEQSNG
jgi:hypothetical protein